LATIISGGKKPLSKENILNNEVFAKIDTWPYLPKGLIGQGAKPITEDVFKEYRNDLSAINKTVEEFVSRQRTIIPWLLAVTIGVLGNLAVNLLFDSPLLRLSELSVGFFIVTLIVIFIMAVAVFFYYPTNCSFIVTFFPHKAVLDNLPAALQTAQLNPIAGSYASDLFSLNEVITEYEEVISLAILRDQIKGVKKSIMRVKELRSLGISQYAPYVVTFDLKHVRFFLAPKDCCEHSQGITRD
jgi:hypothetical protein